MTPILAGMVTVGRDWLAIAGSTVSGLVELQFERCSETRRANMENMQQLFGLRNPLDFVKLQRQQVQQAWGQQARFTGETIDILTRAWDEAQASLRSQFAEAQATANAEQVVVAVESEIPAVHEPEAPTAPRRESQTETLKLQKSEPSSPTPPKKAKVNRKKAQPEQNAHAQSAFELYQGSDEAFRFRLQVPGAGNVLKSEGYRSRNGASNGIASVVRNAVNDARFDRIETASGRYMFNLKAGNHRIIGSSRPYASAREMESEIELLKRCVAAAETRDMTATSG